MSLGIGATQREPESMTDVISAPAAKAEPLFTLNLGENGGVLSPETIQDLRAWISKEQNFWGWTRRNYGGHEQGAREAVDHLAHALNHLQEAEKHQERNPEQTQRQIEACRKRVEEAFLRCRLPNSSTPLGKRVEAYRAEVGDRASSYFLAVFVPPQNGQPNFQAQSLDAWRGLVEGLLERYQLTTTIPRGKKRAAEQSFEELRVRAESLVAEKTAAYDTLHRDYEGLADSIRSTSDEQVTEFTALQQKRAKEFETLKAEHQQEMESLRKTFREEMALRAPAAYWEKKRTGHRIWAIVSGAFSFAGIASAAGLLGWQIHDLLANTPQGAAPETWRLAVLTLIGVFGVWALRLVVRMFLSHLHLLADAGERIVMVQTYLSLLEGDQLEGKEDRQLILQALFRPASDGIVKDEGVPFSFAEILTRTARP